MERVIAYIDGFNLHFGITDQSWKQYLWLDLWTLSRNLLKKGQFLVSTKYFTARIRADPVKAQRQSIYLQALEAMGNIEINYGRYQKKSKVCFSCNSSWTEYEEKMTDVRLACEMILDAFIGAFDIALIVSADADLQPPIEIIKEELPDLKIIVAFPPMRDSFYLRNIVDGYFRISRRSLSKSQLPDKITKADGFVLERPHEWM